MFTIACRADPPSVGASACGSTRKELSMFDFYCDECSQHQLIGFGQVRHLINDGHGIVVVIECWCGTLGAIRTGKGAERVGNR